MTYIIVSFTTVLYFFVNNAINQLMLGIMYVSPFLLILFFPYFKKDETPLILLLLSIWIAGLLHISTFRISTLIYSSLFITTFLLYRRMLYKNIMSTKFFLDLVKIIIYAYAIILIVQQISTLLNIPVFNKCWDFSNKFKLNSLALEPSHIGRILLLLQFAFISVKETILGHKYSLINGFKEDKIIWIAFLYVMITSGSVTCLISLFLLSLYFLGLKKTITAIPIILIIILLFFIFIDTETLLKFEAVNRLNTLLPVLYTFNTDLISETDLSASARVSPIIFYFDLIDISSLSFWFGQGIDFSKNTLITILLGHESEQGNATGGLFPAFFLDYGIITGAFFLYALRKMTLSYFFSFPMFLWLFVFIASPFNTYVQWAFFIIMATVLYFKQIRHK